MMPTVSGFSLGAFLPQSKKHEYLGRMETQIAPRCESVGVRVSYNELVSSPGCIPGLYKMGKIRLGVKVTL